MTPEELRRLILDAAVGRYGEYGAAARLSKDADVEYNNLKRYLRGDRVGKKGQKKDLTATQLLKLTNVLGLTISVSDKSEGELKQAQTCAEPPMHAPETAAQQGGPHGHPVQAERVPEILVSTLVETFTDLTRRVDKLERAHRTARRRR